MRYHTVVTNVIDSDKVAVDGRRSGSPYGIVLYGDTVVLLDGIAPLEVGHPEQENLVNILKGSLLGKKVNVVEFLDTGRSRGGSVYITDDPRRFSKEDNINLRLIREGVAKWSGTCNSSDISPGEMEDAQRLAQAERKGIWAFSEEAPPSSPAPPLLPAATPALAVPAPQEPAAVPARTNAPPVPELSAVSPSRSWFAAPLAAGAGLLAALLLWRGLRRRKP
jgi:endonuclease YncB( thermonuclease family)